MKRRRKLEDTTIALEAKDFKAIGLDAAALYHKVVTVPHLTRELINSDEVLQQYIFRKLEKILENSGEAA